MTVTDQIKILNRKIKQNKAQYNLDREAAKISALSSNNLDKYEYLTSEDLDIKPSTVEQAKFEYSPLGKTFNKGLSEDDKKEGLLKNLKNIEDKNEQLLEIKQQTENIKEITDSVEEPLSPEANALIGEIRAIQKVSNSKKLKIVDGKKEEHDFTDYKTFNELFRDLYYKKMTINDAQIKQNEFNLKLKDLEIYEARKQEYIKAKNSLINNAENFYKGREQIIEGFKKKIFPFESDDDKPKQQQISKKLIKTDVNACNKWINEKEAGINRELSKEHLNFQRPSDMLKNLYKTNDRKKNNKLVSVINSGLKDLEDELEDMSEEERKNEKPDEIVKIVKEILEFNKQNQKGQGLNILTPNQMFSRLPISLAQLKAGNNSEKLKNEIRQLLYSLYRSKKIAKQIYKSLVDII